MMEKLTISFTLGMADKDDELSPPTDEVPVSYVTTANNVGT